ncbi:gamma-aminobutyric acid type B receptor subunit 1-like, partial [Chroicocephalus ridibundus]|uniref:gamma-aminobutyric acid type B receptor subunit 1-like n=1 Tax=Chroicocephalus ridibundus TaxID=1192867 RepID=UPI002FDD0D9F
MLLLPLLLALSAAPGRATVHVNLTEGCQIIHPPRDGGIRYRGLTPEEVQSVRFLPFDYEIEYVCRPDREIVGPKVRKCQRDGTWTAMGHPSRCLRTCPKMHLSLENGQAVARAMERVPVEGTWTEYSCNPGFRLVGSARSNCTKLGRWSTPKPVCELRRPLSGECGPMSPPPMSPPPPSPPPPPPHPPAPHPPRPRDPAGPPHPTPHGFVGQEAPSSSLHPSLLPLFLFL